MLRRGTTAIRAAARPSSYSPGTNSGRYNTSAVVSAKFSVRSHITIPLPLAIYSSYSHLACFFPLWSST